MIRLKWFTLLILCILSVSSVGAGSRAEAGLPEGQIAQTPVRSAQPHVYEKIGANTHQMFGSTAQGESALSQFKRTESQFILIWIAEVLIFCAILVAFNARGRRR